MPPSKVIRIDEQVWAELQKLATPLEDTPNSVLRRVFGLSEEETDDTIVEVAAGKFHEAAMDTRVARLLDAVGSRIGETPQINKGRKVYSFSSKTEKVLAYIRPHKEKLRIAVAKETAQYAGLRGWDRERPKGWFGKPDVRWYIENGDDTAYQQAAEILEKLWKLEVAQQ
jgi:hypothetical protein